MITYLVEHFFDGEDVTQLIAVFNKQEDAALFVPGGFLTEYTCRDEVSRAITRRTELSDLLGFTVEQ